MSKKIENPTTQAVIYFVAVFIISLILWPLLDSFWSGVITHTEFAYNPKEYIVEPLVFAFIMTLIFYVPIIVKHNKVLKASNKDQTKKAKKK